jgi:serine/threonine protein kinase
VKDRTRYCSRCLTTFEGNGESCPNLACQRNRPEQGWGTLLAMGDVLDRHYLVHKRLAIGGAGVTYLAQELDGEDSVTGDRLAIKVLYAQRDQGAYLQRLATEAQILLQLNHPHIVDIRGFVQRAGHSPYLVTRFERGGSLLDHLRRSGSMPLNQVTAIGVNLCGALSRAHGQGVIHRDLKPENILITHIPAKGEIPHLKLTDFGIAKVHGGVGTNLTRVGAFVGTPQFAAPEQFQGQPLTPAADVYSAGAVLLFCITLRPVLAEIDMGNLEKMLEGLLDAVPPLLEGEHGPMLEGFNTFLRATMAFDPKDRVSIDEAAAMLSDLLAGRPVLAPVRLVPSSKTAIPALASGMEKVPTNLSGDTFEGILSQDGDAGTAKHPVELDTGASGLTELEPPAEAEPTVPAPANTEEVLKPEKPSRVPMVLLVMLLVGLCGGGIPMAAWWESPSNIPGFVWDLFPPPPVLQSDSPEALELRASLIAQEPRMIAGCKGSGRIQIKLVLEGNGKVRQIKEIASNDSVLARCVGRNTLDLQFERREARAVLLAVEMDVGR